MIKIRITKIIFNIFVFLCITSIFFFHNKSFLPVSSLLTLILLTVFFHNINKIKREILFEVIILLVYILYSLLIVFYYNINFFDYLIVFLPFYNALILSPSVGKKILEKDDFEKLFFLLLYSFLIKYLYVVLLGIDDRPALFRENNFELMILIIMYIGLYHIKSGQLNLKIISIITFIIAISGSRSSLIEWIAVMFILHIDLKKKYFIAKIALLSITVLIFLYYLSQKIHAGSFESVDRVQYFLSFFYEIRNWNLWKYLFGNPIITPLSYETIQKYSYFSMSYGNPNIAYSVLLHAFVIRAILDHGLFGLVFIFYFINKILKISGYSKKERLAVLTVFFLNGFSVSSFMNIFGVMGLLFLIILKNKRIAYVAK